MHGQPTNVTIVPRSACAVLGASLAIIAGTSIAAGPTVRLAERIVPIDRAEWRELQQGDPSAQAQADSIPAPTPAPGFRTYDGFGNNLQRPNFGAAGAIYWREPNGARYADGRSAPTGGNRPSARVISNTIAAQGSALIDEEHGLSTALYEFGQFLDHDLGRTLTGSTEDFDIAVPSGDAYFDPAGTGTQVIFLDRSSFLAGTGIASPREQVNTETAFIDASHIYGSDANRAGWLRTFAGGRMKVDSTVYGDTLPLNDGTQANENPAGLPATWLRVAGDVRANEQPGLTTLHIAFLREHNAQANRLGALHPEWDDERIFQEARKIIGAEMQVITYQEFLPALIGGPLPPYAGYRPNVDPGTGNTFATAAYRFGHSLVGPDIGVIDESFHEIANLELADVFFNPFAIPDSGGIDPIIRYFALSPAQALDTLVVDPLRNFLFGAPGAGGFDLAALNIQRGRDHGIADYNAVRQNFGLPRVQNFTQITANAALASTLQQLYGTVNTIDAWVGILAEDAVPNGAIGPTGVAVITNQFMRVRDGDRFWYQNVPFDPADLAMIQSTRLADILQRNSGVTGLQPNVFFTAALPFVGCIADLNGDARATIQDFNILAGHFGQSVATRAEGDLNGDGLVNVADFNLFVRGFGCP